MRGALLFALVALFAVAVTADCTLRYHNTLTSGSVTLCGRKNGAIPGGFFKKVLQPGEVYNRQCEETSPSVSFETYFTVVNQTSCGWDTPCDPNTGTCKSYPWVMGQGLSWENGLWYGFNAANFDGAGLGWQGNYADVGYGVSLECMSYGTKRWVGECFTQSGSPICVPNSPQFGHPDTGVVACGPRNSPGVINITLA